MVYDVFVGEQFLFEPNTAAMLSLLTTYQGTLPAGSLASPVISNFICLNMDKELGDYCRSKGFTYTRYADDLSFSTDTKIRLEQISDLVNIVSSFGFGINKRKMHLSSSSARHVVTGLTVNQKVNSSRKLLKNIRAMRHDLDTNGLAAATRHHFKLKTKADPQLQQYFLKRLIGLESFVRWVRG